MRLVMRHLRYFFFLYFPGPDVPESQSLLLLTPNIMGRPSCCLILFPKKDRLVNRFLKIKTAEYKSVLHNLLQMAQ